MRIRSDINCSSFKAGSLTAIVFVHCVFSTDSKMKLISKDNIFSFNIRPLTLFVFVSADGYMRIDIIVSCYIRMKRRSNTNYLDDPLVLFKN